MHQLESSALRVKSERLRDVFVSGVFLQGAAGQVALDEALHRGLVTAVIASSSARASLPSGVAGNSAFACEGGLCWYAIVTGTASAAKATTAIALLKNLGVLVCFIVFLQIGSQCGLQAGVCMIVALTNLITNFRLKAGLQTIIGETP